MIEPLVVELVATDRDGVPRPDVPVRLRAARRLGVWRDGRWVEELPPAKRGVTKKKAAGRKKAAARKPSARKKAAKKAAKKTTGEAATKGASRK